MKFLKITEHVYILEDNPYKGYPYLGYILNENQAFVVDAGFSKRHIDILKNYLNREKLTCPSFGVLTHHHYDHSFGLNSWDIDFFVSNESFNQLKRICKLDYSLNNQLNLIINKDESHWALASINNEYGKDINIFKLDISRCKIYDNENSMYSFKLGQTNPLTIEFISLSNSYHSKDTTIVFIKEDKVIFVGDSLYYDVYGVIQNYNEEDCKDFFETILKLDFNKVVFGHQEVGSKDDVLKLYKEHMKILFNKDL